VALESIPTLRRRLRVPTVLQAANPFPTAPVVRFARPAIILTAARPLFVRHVPRELNPFQIVQRVLPVQPISIPMAQRDCFLFVPHVLLVTNRQRPNLGASLVEAPLTVTVALRFCAKPAPLDLNQWRIVHSVLLVALASIPTAALHLFVHHAPREINQFLTGRSALPAPPVRTPMRARRLHVPFALLVANL
jgi:hypothetical protein